MILIGNLGAAELQWLLGDPPLSPGVCPS